MTIPLPEGKVEAKLRVKDLLLRARVVVRTSNMKISRRRLADYVKTLHQKACRTCSTIIFLHSTNQIIDLWRCRWRCRRQILNSLLFFICPQRWVEEWLKMRLILFGEELFERSFFIDVLVHYSRKRFFRNGFDLELYEIYLVVWHGVLLVFFYNAWLLDCLWESCHVHENIHSACVF